MVWIHYLSAGVLCKCIFLHGLCSGKEAGRRQAEQWWGSYKTPCQFKTLRKVEYLGGIEILWSTLELLMEVMKTGRIGWQNWRRLTMLREREKEKERNRKTKTSISPEAQDRTRACRTSQDQPMMLEVEPLRLRSGWIFFVWRAPICKIRGSVGCVL